MLRVEGFGFRTLRGSPSWTPTPCRWTAGAARHQCWHSELQPQSPARDQCCIPPPQIPPPQSHPPRAPAGSGCSPQPPNPTPPTPLPPQLGMEEISASGTSYLNRTGEHRGGMAAAAAAAAAAPGAAAAAAAEMQACSPGCLPTHPPTHPTRARHLRATLVDTSPPPPHLSFLPDVLPSCRGDPGGEDRDAHAQVRGHA